VSAPALRRGLKILEMVAASPRGASFSELSREISIPCASTARLLSELCRMRFLAKREDDGRYFLGPKLFEIVPRPSIRDRMAQAGGPILYELTARTGNTTLLFHWDGVRVSCIAKEEHPESLGMQRVGGTSTDILVPPWGWIFYQTLDEARREELKLRTRASAAEMRELDENLALLRRRGFAVKKKRNGAPTRRLAAPVRCPGVGLVGALAMGGTAYAVPDDRIPALGRLLVEKADELGEWTAVRAPAPP
jgi:DNA-binding IclR family transcriptional regulator